MRTKSPVERADSAEMRAMRSAVARWRGAAIAAALAALASAGLWLTGGRKESADISATPMSSSPSASPSGGSPPGIDPSAPYAREVAEVLAPLRYSGIPALLRPEVRLVLMPARRQWRLRDLRRISPDGEVLLDEGRYGACGELAAFTAQHLRRIFPRSYSVQMVRAAQSDYFPHGTSTHFALLIQDLKDSKNFFAVDPSFGRYGRYDDFDDYLFYRTRQPVESLSAQQRDFVGAVGQYTPLLIRNERILSVGIDAVNGLFDREHFAVRLFAVRRGRFFGKPILLLARSGGKIAIQEDRGLADAVFSAQEYASLRARLERLMEEAVTAP